jgi:ribonuclease HI
MYVIGTLTKHWKIKKNKDLWKFMYNTIKSLKHKINFIHVKGHADNEYNNLCDELAVFYSKIN